MQTYLYDSDSQQPATSDSQTVHRINLNLIRILPFTDELLLWYLHFVVICCFLVATSQRKSSKKNTRDVNL